LTNPTAAPSPRGNGLQAERTTLAWTRTSFAFLANGALLTVRDLHGIRDLHGVRGPAGLIPAGLAAVVALCTYLIALQRQRTLARRPLPTRICPRRQVYLVGAAVLALILLTEVAQLVVGYAP
jgi:uncharacterized membrane protein YidH (DUF202 family)